MDDTMKVFLLLAAVALFALAAKSAIDAADAKNPQTRWRDARKAWTDASIGMQLLKM